MDLTIEKSQEGERMWSSPERTDPSGASDLEVTLIAELMLSRNTADCLSAALTAFVSSSVAVLAILKYRLDTDILITISAGALDFGSRISSVPNGGIGNIVALLRGSVDTFFLSTVSDTRSVILKSTTPDASVERANYVIGIEIERGIWHLFLLHVLELPTCRAPRNMVALCQIASTQLERAGSPRSQRRIILTQREKECLTFSAEGLSEKEIASKLTLSTNTIRVHIENAKRKCGASNKCHAVALCIAAGAIDLMSPAAIALSRN
jgi:DNA-binding CsgD family transcriptional regulator